jgi:hypothetical protein
MTRTEQSSTTNKSALLELAHYHGRQRNRAVDALRPMKRTTDEQVAAFQIDEETVTCWVRLLPRDCISGKKGAWPIFLYQYLQ